MTRYAYSAISRRGVLEAGELEASSQDAVVETLRKSGATPLQVSSKSRRLPQWLMQPWRVQRGVRSGEVLKITQQLASLSRAGLHLDRGLAVVTSLCEQASLKEVLRQLTDRIKSGVSFSASLKEHPSVFPAYYCSMVQAGELGGSLPEVLSRLSQLLERAERLRERVRSALIYPAILAAMIGATLVLMMTVVLPRFEQLFLEARATLPWPTRVVLALADFSTSYGALVILIVAAALLWTMHQLRTSSARRATFDNWLLRKKVLGSLIANLECARFLRTLGTLLTNGVALPTAVAVAKGAFRNRALAGATERLLVKLKEGSSFGSLLAATPAFPRLAVQLARVGEETGHLDEMLGEAAEILDQEAQTTLERLLSILVPMITVGMGVVVAALIGSVLVGILSVNDLAF